jgi:hypothetical protein
VASKTHDRSCLGDVGLASQDPEFKMIRIRIRRKAIERGSACGQRARNEGREATRMRAATTRRIAVLMIAGSMASKSLSTFPDLNEESAPAEVHEAPLLRALLYTDSSS